MTRATKEAREEIKTMVELANTLIAESINTSDPVEPVQRTIPKEDFARLYNEHSNNLIRLLDQIENDSPGGVADDIDKEVNRSREELKQLVDQLHKKMDQIGDLCFWMDNMQADKAKSAEE